MQSGASYGFGAIRRKPRQADGFNYFWIRAACGTKLKTPAAAPGALADLGHRLGAEGTLIGRATGATLAAAVRWTFLFQDRSSEFSGPLEGINRAADTYAGIFAVSGSLLPVDIEVTGVRDVRD